MPIKLYTVIYSGETLSGKDPAEVRESLKSLLELSQKDIESLSTGRPVVLLKDGDKDEAMSLKNALLKIGALAAVQSAVPRVPKSPEGPLTLLDMCLPESGGDPCAGSPGPAPEARDESSAAQAIRPEPAASGVDASVEDDLKDPDYAAAILDLAASAPGQVAKALGSGFRRWAKAAFGRPEETETEPDRMIQSIATGSFLGMCLTVPGALYGYLARSDLFFGMNWWRTAICIALVILVVPCSRRFGLKGFAVSGLAGLTAILALSGGRLTPLWLFTVLASLFVFLGLAALAGAALGAALGFLAWEWAEKRDDKKDADDPLV